MLIRASKYEFRLSKWPKLTLFGAFRAIKIPKKLILVSINYFNQSPPTLFRGQATKILSEGAKCLSEGQNANLSSQNGQNWRFQSFQGKKYTKKLFLESKNYFNQSPPTFFRGQVTKRSPEGAKCLLGGQNISLGSQNGHFGDPKMVCIQQKHI